MLLRNFLIKTLIAKYLRNMLVFSPHLILQKLSRGLVACICSESPSSQLILCAYVKAPVTGRDDPGEKGHFIGCLHFLHSSNNCHLSEMSEDLNFSSILATDLFRPLNFFLWTFQFSS